MKVVLLLINIPPLNQIQVVLHHSSLSRCWFVVFDVHPCCNILWCRLSVLSSHDSGIGLSTEALKILESFAVMLNRVVLSSHSGRVALLVTIMNLSRNSQPWYSFLFVSIGIPYKERRSSLQKATKGPPTFLFLALEMETVCMGRQRKMHRRDDV